MCNSRITVLLIIAYSGFIKPCSAVPIHIHRAPVQNSPLKPQIQQQQHQPYQQPSINGAAAHIHLNIQTPKSQHELPPHRSHTYNNQENNIVQERLPGNPSHITHEATYNNAIHNNVEDSHKNILPNYNPNSQFQNNVHHRFNSGQIGAHEANVANIDGQWSSQPQPQQPGGNINMQGKEQLEPICTSAGCRDRNIHMNGFNQNHLNMPHEIQKQPVKHPYVSNAINSNEIHQPKHHYGSNSINMNVNEMKYPDNRMPPGSFPRSSNHNPNSNNKLDPSGTNSNNININNGNTHHGLRPLEIRDRDPIHSNRPLPPHSNSHSSSTVVIPAANNQIKGHKQQQTALMKIEYDIADKDERDTYETSIMDVVDEL